MLFIFLPEHYVILYDHILTQNNMFHHINLDTAQLCYITHLITYFSAFSLLTDLLSDPIPGAGTAGSLRAIGLCLSAAGAFGQATTGQPRLVDRDRRRISSVAAEHTISRRAGRLPGSIHGRDCALGLVYSYLATIET